MNDTRIWSAAQMRALFPHKKPKCVHHLQAEDALKEVVSSDTGTGTNDISYKPKENLIFFATRAHVY